MDKLQSTSKIHNQFDDVTLGDGVNIVAEIVEQSKRAARRLRKQLGKRDKDSSTPEASGKADSPGVKSSSAISTTATQGTSPTVDENSETSTITGVIALGIQNAE